jgi:hypothetical protein
MDYLAIPEESQSLPPPSIILLAINTAPKPLYLYSKDILLFKGSIV